MIFLSGLLDQTPLHICLTGFLLHLQIWGVCKRRVTKDTQNTKNESIMSFYFVSPSYIYKKQGGLRKLQR